jgi:hypothetical protein
MNISSPIYVTQSSQIYVEDGTSDTKQDQRELVYKTQQY